MELVNRIELRLKDYEKCSVFIENDMPIGRLYDFSCALQAFCVVKMQEANEQAKPKSDKIEELPQSE